MKRTMFDGRTAVITGAGSGIGRATAIHAAQKGARLVLADSDAASLADTVALVAGQVIHHEAFDVGSEDAVAAFAHRTLDLGPVDIVVNADDIGAWGHIEDLTSYDWRGVIDVGLMGPIHVLSVFVPAMIAAGDGGHVVNVASAAGLFGMPGQPLQGAAKFGLRGLSEVLRFDLEEHDIGVTLVCPGAVRTPLVESAAMVGIDRQHPAVRALVDSWERQAVSAEDVATALVQGVEKGSYLVFTSNDVRLKYYLQRYAPWAYAHLMRRMNRKVNGIMAKGRSADGAQLV